MKDFEKTVCYSVDYCGNKTRVNKYLLVVIQDGTKTKLITEKGSAKVEREEGGILIIKTGYCLRLTLTVEEYKRFLGGGVVTKTVKSGTKEYPINIANNVEALVDLSNGQILEMKDVKVYNYTH